MTQAMPIPEPLLALPPGQAGEMAFFGSSIRLTGKG